MTGTALAKYEPLPIPTIAEPAPKWPDWIATLVVRNNFQPDPATGKWDSLPTLPPGRTVSAEQRREIENHRDKMVQLIEQTPSRSRGVAEKVFLIISKLILAMPARAAGPETAEARIDSYMIAVNDVAGWAVDKAAKDWYRGSCYVSGAGDFNYSFAPSPADLRRIALSEIVRPRKRIALLDKILSAVPYVQAERPPLQWDKDEFVRKVRAGRQ